MRKTDVVVSVNVPDTLALRHRLTDIPIVAWAIEDPVAVGLAESFTRPGGNVTGLTQGMEAVFARQVDVLAKLVPRLSGIAVLGYRGEKMRPETVRQFELLEGEIRGHGFRHVSIPTVGPRALEAFPGLKGQGAQAAIYFHNPQPLGRDTQRRHAEVAIAHGIATMGYFANLADDGFLASYGELDADLFLRLAQQVDRILRGADPRTLPFMGPQRFHLRINRRTAERLGVALTPEIRLLADEVIG
jgi:putative ABC transport system substrate-binding protein